MTDDTPPEPTDSPADSPRKPRSRKNPPRERQQRDPNAKGCESCGRRSLDVKKGPLDPRELCNSCWSKMPMPRDFMR